jgi:hypothetical protein
MAKPLLIFVHGSGKYSDTWSTKHRARLAEIAATYPGIATNGPLEDQVEIVPLNYDTVFRALLDRWRTQDDQLSQFLGESGLSLPGMLGFLNDQTVPPPERDFFWTHVMDPVLYRGFTTVRAEVRATVAQQIVSATNAHLALHPGAEISIMGHSLGTIVNHDVLHLLGTGQTTEHGDVWRSDRFTFANIFQVANASRLGPPGLLDPDPYRSVVRPSTAPPGPGGSPGYCYRMFSFRNRWDPVPGLQPFDPQGWGEDYREVRIEHVHQANVHGFIHYLNNPEVHVEVFRALLGYWTVDDDLYEQRVEEFSNIDIPCGNEIVELKTALESVVASTNGEDFDEIITANLEFYRAIKAAEQACGALVGAVDDML